MTKQTYMFVRTFARIDNLLIILILTQFFIIVILMFTILKCMQADVVVSWFIYFILLIIYIKYNKNTT